MTNIFRRIAAVHASVAYLSMLTGFGGILFSALLVYLLIPGNAAWLLPACDLCRWALLYVLLVIGPGAIAMAAYFYVQSHKIDHKTQSR